jgi:four helix bundle protein
MVEITRWGYAPEGAKRRYEAHFVSKLTDADGENGETETWLDFAHDCGYLSEGDHALFTEKSREVGAMLGSMISDPSSFILKPTSDRPRQPDV